jgi:hypothetical protein
VKPRPPAKVEIRCPACGRDAWLARTPRYDGFERVGEELRCALCRHEFASEADVPYKDGARPRVFTDADRPRPVKVFSEEEKGRTCRHCAQYVVNPFVQRCALHGCEVEATDTCPHFRPKSVEPPPDPLSRLGI